MISDTTIFVVGLVTFVVVAAGLVFTVFEMREIVRRAEAAQK